MACILQGKDSIYETDVFRGIIERIEGLTGKPYGETAAIDTAIRIVAEHTRARCFLITDGVLPSNEGRGYVLRRILRRAVYHLTQAGRAPADTLLDKVAEAVIAQMERAYPDLRDRASFIDAAARGRGVEVPRDARARAGASAGLTNFQLRSPRP